MVNLHITWPIQNPHQSLRTMKNEALADLRRTLAMHGLLATSNPTVAVTHGAEPTITITVPVRRHLAVVA